MTTDEGLNKASLKQRVKLAQATGLLMGAKKGLQTMDEFNKDGLIKLIDEVLELLE